MKKELAALIKEFKSDSRIPYFDKTRVKQAMLLNILSIIGWNIFDIDEVFPDYPVSGRSVDFSLRTDNENKVFIFVKDIGENLKKFESELLELSKAATAEIAVLTNGFSWWLYLPGVKKNENGIKFYNLDVNKQSVETLTKKFIAFLSKDHVVKGKSVAEAIKTFKSRKKKSLIKDALDEVWKSFTSGSDDTLKVLLAEESEKISGYPSDLATVTAFLKAAVKGKSGKKITEKKVKFKKPGRKPGRKPGAKRGRKKIIEKAEKKERIKVAPENKMAKEPKRGSFIGKKPVSFSFLGRKYKVKKWKEVLINICNILSKVREDVFEKVLELKGRKRIYFSRDEKNLKEPRKVSGTDIFVETNFNASNLYMITLKVLETFGYKESDIKIETK